ncbi:MAG TPA: hypothetical protein VMV49_08790 [Candidatus Deferrimicrobium sp.]|nr:hypothetical protein [Candidatus Deferrimicrobium sp.]
MQRLVLPFVGGNHPFARADLESIEVAGVLMSAEDEKKKKEKFLGIFKTYLPLWIVSIDGSNGIMVEAMILNSEKFRMKRFDKTVELDPQRDLASGSFSDFTSKLQHYESKINSYQREEKIELNGYINPTIAGEIRILFEKLEQQNIPDLGIMSQRLSQESAELMCTPIISVFHVQVNKILHDLYQIPIIVNTQLLQLYDEFRNITSEYVNKMSELSQKVDSLEETDSFKVQHRKASNIITEFTSFRDTKDRNIKKLFSQWDEIRSLNEKIQQGYLNLLDSVFQTKNEILDLSTPFSHTSLRGQAVSVLLPIYVAIFQEKKSRITYFPPLILDFAHKKELTRPKGFEFLKREFEHKYSSNLPPGISEIEDQNLLLNPHTQQNFNDGVHKLRETKIIGSNTYVRIMDSYNEFFRKAHNS